MGAEDLKEPVWTIENKPTKLKKGQPAPFDGHLVTTESLVRSLVELDKVELKGKLELDYLQKKLDAELALQTSLKTSIVETEQAKYKLLEEAKKTQATYYEQNIQQLRSSADRKWWESPYLHFGLGFGAAALISVVTILLLH